MGVIGPKTLRRRDRSDFVRRLVFSIGAHFYGPVAPIAAGIISGGREPPDPFNLPCDGVVPGRT